MIEHVEAKGLSQRAACRYTGISRAVCRYELRCPVRDAQCLEKMRTAARVNNEMKCPQIIGLKSPLFHGSPVQWDSLRSGMGTRQTF